MQNAPSLVKARRSSERGLTLVELMASVAIVGLLAMVGSVSVKKYIASSKTSEAIRMIGSIKAAQETMKDETYAYLNVSSGINDFYPNNPKPGRQKMNFPGTVGDGRAKWDMLGIHEDAPVLFVYACTAGLAGEKAEPGTGITVKNWPGTMDRPWYVVKAKADVDGDGADTVYLAASFAGEIFSANE